MRKKITVDEYLAMIDEWHGTRIDINNSVSITNKLLKKLSNFEKYFENEIILEKINSEKLNDWQLLYLAGCIYSRTKDLKMVNLIRTMLHSKDRFTKWDAQTFFMLHKDLK